MRRAWAFGVTAGAAFAFVAVASACGSFSEEKTEPTGGTDGAVAADGAPPEAASEGATDGGAEELLTNPGFELAPCANWEVNNGKLSAAGDAHGGQAACRVCRDSSGSTLTLFQSASAPAALPGQDYRFTIWVRTAPPASAPRGLRLLIDYGANDRADIDESGPTDAWREIAVAGRVKAGGSPPKVEVRFDSTSTSDCMVVDDASLVRVP